MTDEPQRWLLDFTEEDMDQAIDPSLNQSTASVRSEIEGKLNDILSDDRRVALTDMEREVASWANPIEHATVDALSTTFAMSPICPPSGAVSYQIGAIARGRAFDVGRNLRRA